MAGWDAAEVGGRQATADLGQRLTVAVAQEDGRPVGLEEHHGVIGETAEDAVQLEPAADVAGDPSECLGPVKVLGHFLGPTANAHDAADRLGGQGGQLRVALGDRVACRQQHAPGSSRPGDRGGRLHRGISNDRFGGRGRHGRPVLVWAACDSGKRAARRRGCAAQRQRPSEDAAVRR